MEPISSPSFRSDGLPLANGLVRAEDLDRQEPQFPLDFHMCTGCAHVQLLDVVDPGMPFRDYVYVSGTSATFVQHSVRTQRSSHRGLAWFVEYIVDESPLKQGQFTPGFHIPIVAPARLRDDPPDYVLILAWNFADSIRERQRAFAERGGRFIVPLPNVEVH